MTWVLRWLVRAVLAVFVIALSVIAGGALHAMLSLPDLREWHRFAPPAEADASDLGDTVTLKDYLAREAAVFREVEEHFRTVAARDESIAGTRFDPASRSSPAHATRDWNRTFELEPTELRGGALLVHGLTDAPYSMRPIAERLAARGWYVLSLRMPGHGTVPTGLVRARAEDWSAAVSMGARHVRGRIGPARPMILVGYSNGGALVMQHAVDAAAVGTPDVSGVVLLSPMIGVSPMARFARLVGALGVFAPFEKARWLDIVPEYNPFKYNSFPVNAGQQSYRVSSALQAALARAAASGAIDRVPPVLAFQSVVDATVETPAVVTDLFDRLHGPHHALVVFDINRAAGLEPYIRPEFAALPRLLAAGGPRTYRRTLVTNLDEKTLAVGALRLEPGSGDGVRAPINREWPPQMFSLSHIALPFPSDDPVYGIDPSIPAGSLALGRLSPRGEKAVLTVPIDTLMRIGWNPFFEFMAGEIESWLDALPAR